MRKPLVIVKRQKKVLSLETSAFRLLSFPQFPDSFGFLYVVQRRLHSILLLRRYEMSSSALADISARLTESQLGTFTISPRELVSASFQFKLC